MSDAGTTTPDPTPNPGTPPPAGDKDKLDSLNSWAKSFGAREKAEGRASVERDIAEKLGMSLEDAARLIGAGKEAEESKLSEAEKKLARAEERNRESRELSKSAHQVILDTLKRDALQDLGMTKDQARASVELVNVDISGPVTLESVVEAAAATRLLFPQLFTATPPPPGGHGTNGADRQGPPDSANRSVAPPPGGTGNAARDRAVARLVERHQRVNPPRILQREPEIDAQRRSS